MKAIARVLALGVWLAAAGSGRAATRYVDVNSATPAAPYTNWATAARVIQDAVEAAVTGDEIMVTNGLYATGGRAVTGTMTNRVAIDRAVTVRSVNGPLATIIEGRAVPGTTNGDGAIRCVYVGTNVVLSGFTLTNGHTRVEGDEGMEQSGGGAWFEGSGVATNCWLSANSAGYSGGGAYGGNLNNCTLRGNWAGFGGGACGGILNDCTFSGNSADGGGGAWRGALNNCTLSDNSVYTSGGGAGDCTLINCTLRGNSAFNGGGAAGGTLSNCLISGNSAIYLGGGASSSTLKNCTLCGNLVNDAVAYGGGAYECTLNGCNLTGNSANGSYCMGGGVSGGTLSNCTLTGNSASSMGGGAYSSALYNCIVYYNLAPNGANYDASSSFNYCCSTPLPPGPGNIDSEPLFVDTNAWSNLRLQSNSPCINAGNNAYVLSLTDLDGQPRIKGGTVDIGAYEFQSPASVISYAWLQNYGLPTDGSADFADSDADLMNNWQEWVAGTDPRDAASALRMLSVSNAVPGIAASWTSVTNRTYSLERSTDLGLAPTFSTVRSNLDGQAGSTSFTDTNASGLGPFFYRVRVQN